MRALKIAAAARDRTPTFVIVLLAGWGIQLQAAAAQYLPTFHWQRLLTVIISTTIQLELARRIDLGAWRERSAQRGNAK